MSLGIESVSDVQEYLSGVLGRADHHADAVRDIALALLGAVIWKNVGTLTVRTHAGEKANIIWFNTEARRYALKFNHETGKIELHADSHMGPLVHEFSNATPLAEVRQVFSPL